MTEFVDIVDKNDIVVGRVKRDEMHAKGLCARFVYIWFYTPNKDIIMQRRSAQKSHYPGRLVATVSGHVPSGMTYLDAAIKEVHEETGQTVERNGLEDQGIVYSEYTDALGLLTKAFRSTFLHKFEGKISDLTVDPEEGDGFEAWNIKKLLLHMETEPDIFTPFILENTSKEILRKLQG